MHQLDKVSCIDIEVPVSCERQATLRPVTFDKLRGGSLLEVGHTLSSAGTGRSMCNLLKTTFCKQNTSCETGT